MTIQAYFLCGNPRDLFDNVNVASSSLVQSSIGADVPVSAPQTVNILSSDSSRAEGKRHSTIDSSSSSNYEAFKPQPPRQAYFFPNAQVQDLLHLSNDEADSQESKDEPERAPKRLQKNYNRTRKFQLERGAEMQWS